MKILEHLRQAFSRCLGSPDQGDEKEPILEREEIALSEIPEAVDALICKIKVTVARQREPLGHDDVMDLIEGLPDVGGSDADGRGLFYTALRAVDDLVRRDPEISPEWYNERGLGRSPIFDESFFGVIAGIFPDKNPC